MPAMTPRALAGEDSGLFALTEPDLPSDACRPDAPMVQPIPQFPVHLAPPDVDPWVAGNTGIPGFVTRDSDRSGLHVALIALTHGNELAGAIVLDQLLRQGFRPRCGRLTFGFANLAA